jgi:lipid-binding SYLF domain-containing protein
MRIKVLSMVAACAALCLSVAVPRPAAQATAEAERLTEAARVLDEIMGAPDKAIPAAVIEKAEGIAVFPSTIKGGLGLGAHRGKGVFSTRNRATETWSAPAFLTLTGGSIGAQIGAQAVDLVLIVLNTRGIEKLSRNTMKFGGDASVAAGPVGRDVEASTDASFRAEILSYSRTRGLFAGVTLKGSAIRVDRDAHERVYGTAFSTAQVVSEGKGGSPALLAPWTAALARHFVVPGPR